MSAMNDPYEDPTQGRTVGHDPHEDPTEGGKVGGTHTTTRPRPEISAATLSRTRRNPASGTGFLR
jgi:hypothetical protein